MLSESTVIVCLSALGALIGLCVNEVVRKLPTALQQAWCADACELLGLAKEDRALYGCNARHVAGHSLLRYGFALSASSVLTCWVVLQFGVTPKALAALLFALGLLTVSMIDIEHMLLPDMLVLPLLWGGLLLNSLGLFTSVDDALWGAACAYLGLIFVHVLYKRITGRDGLGLGDAKLLAAIGAWGGWQVLIGTLLVAALSSALVILALLLTGRIKRGTLLPFGPFLALGGWLAITSTI
ncbi:MULTISPECIES: prepilin peptidase [Pseudomonas]|nr:MULTISPECIES: A24 family peptidase [Pseudomonas]MCC9290246.1 A24 family peptidase [Pseudomonas aeruginosa]